MAGNEHVDRWGAEGLEPPTFAFKGVMNLQVRAL
jgi:hypothetical protein